MIALTRNDYEPDICFWNKEKATNFTDETMLHPAPDFVVEVLSKKNMKLDRTVKFKDYALHQIPEYWIIDPWAKIVEQYWLNFLPELEYNLVAKWRIGDQIKAKAIEGFVIPVAAVFNKEDCNAALRQFLNP
jgi:Uma2 family endonuclease